MTTRTKLKLLAKRIHMSSRKDNKDLIEII